MTLDAVRCFCAVVETGNFRLAAERVHRSQPAVTQRIKGLEREFGHVLLDRRTGRPTPAGQLVYDRGRRLLMGAESLREEVADFDESASRELRIGTSDTNALYFLPAEAAKFSRRMKDTRLVVHCRSSDAIADEVERGEVDIGIVTLPLNRDNLETRKLFEQRMALVVPNEHPLGALRQTSLGKLKQEAFVLIHEGTRTGGQLRDFFDAHGFSPQVIMDSGSFEVIKQYVAEGLGLSFIPEMALRKADRDRLTALRVAGLPRVGIGAIWRSDAYMTKAARAFLEQISRKQRSD